MMRNILLTLTLLLTSLSLAAQQDAAIKFVASKNKDLKAKFSFVQNNVDPVVKKTETLRGTLSFSSPRKLSMLYTEPNGDKFIIDGDNFERVKTGKTTKINLKKVKSYAGLADLLCNGMMGLVDEIRKASNASMTYTSGKSTHDFLFVPDKKSHTYFKEVHVRYDKKTGRVTYLKLVEKSGKYSEYTLTLM